MYSVHVMCKCLLLHKQLVHVLYIVLILIHVGDMSLFGRIKSAVVGNPVTKEYELGRHIASAGPGLMWKVYSATKKTTRQVYITCMYHNLLSIEVLLYNVHV